MRKTLAVIGLIALAGCGPRGGNASDTSVELALVAPPSSPGAPGPPAANASQMTPQMAYIYRYGLELPKTRLASVMAVHEQACAGAGPALCQVISSSSNQAGGNALSGRLELRAAPAWVARFRSEIDSQARAAGGQVVLASTYGEDLILSLIDTEARLRAKITLRDRLQQLLATRSGDLGELLKVENELARVQGEIDSVQSSLTVLRTRVATSRLDIDYNTTGTVAGEGVFAPVQRALAGASGAFMTTVGALITILAVVAPIALIAIPLVWWLVGLRRRRKARRAAVPGPIDPAT